MSKVFEKVYPAFGGVLGAAVYLLFFRHFALSETLKDLFLSAISVSAISAGFLATTKSILVSIEDRPVIQRLKEAEKFSLLVSYLMTAVHCSFILAVLSAVAVIFNLRTPQWWYPYAFGVWIFMVVFAILSYQRVISIFSEILKS